MTTFPFWEKSLPRGGWRLAMVRDAAFEQVEVVADGHGKSEQFLEALLRFIEFDGDAARFETYAGGEVFKFLIHDGGGSFDQQLRLGRSTAAAGSRSDSPLSAGARFHKRLHRPRRSAPVW